jgi:hypothetical protein
VKSHPARQATSLLELFYKAELKPSLSSRIRLATSLATTMLQLHSAGWLHKGFRSDNIVFFHSQGDVTSLDLDSPFVMGYEHSRLDSSNAISEIPSVNPEEDMYRHPLAHPAAGSPFRKGFDVYALGLVLLELAKWKPLRHIAKKSVNRSQITQQDLERLRQDLCGERLTDAIVDVEFRAGTVYADVVYHCLAKTCIFKGPGAQVPEEFYESFVSNVIRPLMCCKV